VALAMASRRRQQEKALRNNQDGKTKERNKKAATIK